MKDAMDDKTVNFFLVDDEDIGLQFYTEMIKVITGMYSEVDIMVFKKPKDALEKAREYGVDILMTDIQMPEMSGLELIRKMRIINPGIKVIALSSQKEYEDDVFKISPTYSFFRKPIDRPGAFTLRVSNCVLQAVALKACAVSAAGFGKVANG